jgi:hypothetical protein
VVGVMVVVAVVVVAAAVAAAAAVVILWRTWVCRGSKMSQIRFSMLKSTKAARLYVCPQKQTYDAPALNNLKTKATSIKRCCHLSARF